MVGINTVITYNGNSCHVIAFLVDVDVISLTVDVTAWLFGTMRRVLRCSVGGIAHVVREDDMSWKRFPHNRPLWGDWSEVYSHHKWQALARTSCWKSLIWTFDSLTSCWTNSRCSGDLRRHYSHTTVIRRKSFAYGNCSNDHHVNIYDVHWDRKVITVIAISLFYQ